MQEIITANPITKDPESLVYLFDVCNIPGFLPEAERLPEQGAIYFSYVESLKSFEVPSLDASVLFGAIMQSGNLDSDEKGVLFAALKARYVEAQVPLKDTPPIFPFIPERAEQLSRQLLQAKAPNSTLLKMMEPKVTVPIDSARSREYWD